MQDLSNKAIQQAVLVWYKTNGRHDLPWREFDINQNQLAYHVLVSEFMLQQTQVERVIPKYVEFLKMFPTVHNLATASSAQVISLWSGLGYNRRAVMLHKAAQAVVADYNGIVPADVDLLAKLPGFGPYTSAAVCAFAFNMPVAVVDTNIIRFYELLILGYGKPSRQEITQLAELFVPVDQGRDWHSALMDLMSEIRKIRSPKAQQEALIKILNLSPDWNLPQLTDALLVRPKQSTFRESKRYYRGRVVAFLSQQNNHKSVFKDIKILLENEKIPPQYEIVDLLQGLKKDGLIMFGDTITPSTQITLTH